MIFFCEIIIEPWEGNKIERKKSKSRSINDTGLARGNYLLMSIYGIGHVVKLYINLIGGPLSFIAIASAIRNSPLSEKYCIYSEIIEVVSGSFESKWSLMKFVCDSTAILH